MPKILDLSGLACPLPVIRTKEALEGGESQEFVVVVDNDAARDNVSRFAQSRGCTVAVAQAGNCYHLTIQPPAGQPGEGCLFPGAASPPPSHGGGLRLGPHGRRRPGIGGHPDAGLLPDRRAAAGAPEAALL